MFSRNVRHAMKYGLYGTIAVTGVVTAAKYQTDYDTLSIVRVTRTAVTAVKIGRIYKNMLYSKEWDITSPEYLELRSRAHKIGAEELLDLCKTNKGVYIKVGQHIGALSYLLPNEYVSTMSVLHKDAPRNTVDELYDVIREDLKVEPTELFLEFDKEPLGTASLAQVHRAKLKDGQEVAVKVQHQFVRKSVKIDLAWMEFIIHSMSKVFPEFQMQWLVDETKKNIYKELNFLEEGRNAEKVASTFANFPWVKVPKIFWDYSTQRVLVMEYLTGGQVNDVEYIKKHKIDPYDLVSKIGDLYSYMIFDSGFMHSDPHPGNILVKKGPNDKDVTVIFLDHGLYAQLTDRFRYHYSKLWLSILGRDRNEMKKHAQALGISGDLYGLFACMVTGRPWESILKGIDRTVPSSEEKKVFQNELPSLLHYVTQCLENVDRQALLVLKTNDLIRGIEYALGTQGRMVGFMVMSKYCCKTVYKQEYKKEESTWKRQILSVRYAWTRLTLYLYGFYLLMVERSYFGFS